MAVPAVIDSIVIQDGVRQLILVADGPEPLRQLNEVTALGRSRGVQVQALWASEVLGERAFLMTGQLANFDPCILWDTSALIPPGVVAALGRVWRDDHLVGIAGRDVGQAAAWTDAPVAVNVKRATTVGYLELFGMMLHRRFLQLPFEPLRPTHERHLAMWVCAYAQTVMGARCSVVSGPLVAAHFQGRGQQPSDDEAELSFAFILFGKSSEITTNRREDQELTMLALHLLQNSLVYINTLMLKPSPG